MAKSVGGGGGKWLFRVVCTSESPVWEVPLYKYLCHYDVIAHLRTCMIIALTFRRNPVVSQLWDQGRIVEGLNAIKWSPDTVQDLENTVLSGVTGVGCASVSCREDSYNYYNTTTFSRLAGSLWFIEHCFTIQL